MPIAGLDIVSSNEVDVDELSLGEDISGSCCCCCCCCSCIGCTVDVK